MIVIREAIHKGQDYIHGIVLVPDDEISSTVMEKINKAYGKACKLDEWSYTDVIRILREEFLLVVIANHDVWDQPCDRLDR